MQVATLAVITRPPGEVLLGLKKGGCEIGEGTLNAPGGTWKPGESLTQCLVRETKKEVGITLNPKKLRRCALVNFWVAGTLDFEVYVFRTCTFSGEPRETRTMLPAWYNVDNLPFDQMLESDKWWFPQILKRDVKFRADVYSEERAKHLRNITFTQLKKI